jgi:D-tyrosyl-tRNA(Tyr) deacylase
VEAGKGVRVVIQRVSQACVMVADEVVGRIAAGLCIFAGFGPADQNSNVAMLAQRILDLRIFEDAQAKMNLSLLDVKGEILAVSQFTLYGDCSRGHRPSLTGAAPPDCAERLYNYFLDCLKASGLKVAAGRFRAHMNVSLTNDGPVTFILEN